jgi:hypothetical protein
VPELQIIGDVDAALGEEPVDERLIECEPQRDRLVERRELAPDTRGRRTSADLQKATLELDQLSSELGGRLSPGLAVPCSRRR